MPDTLTIADAQKIATLDLLQKDPFLTDDFV